MTLSYLHDFDFLREIEWLEICLIHMISKHTKKLVHNQNVLFYGHSRKIFFQNKATVNENPIDKLIRELKEENERLKKSLGGGPVELGSEAAGMTEDEKAAMRAEIEAELRAQESF